MIPEVAIYVGALVLAASYARGLGPLLVRPYRRLAKHWGNQDTWSSVALVGGFGLWLALVAGSIWGLPSVWLKLAGGSAVTLAAGAALSRLTAPPPNREE